MSLFKKIVEKEVGSQVIAEFKFHPKRRWRFDFAIPEFKVAIEQEGGVWTGGRHVRGRGYVGDLEKYNAAAVLGWTVLRYTPKQMLKTKTLNQIKKICSIKRIR